MNFLRRLYEKIFYIEDIGDNYTNGRRWRYWPEIGFYKGRFYIGVCIQLIQVENKPRKPDAIQDATIQLFYDPRKWVIGQEHIYYDGPHCHYQFGPFAWNTSWRWCKKCMPDEE